MNLVKKMCEKLEWIKILPKNSLRMEQGALEISINTSLNLRYSLEDKKSHS